MQKNEVMNFKFYVGRFENADSDLCNFNTDLTWEEKMKEKKKYRYRERIFLNEDYENSTFVVAIVENSKHSQKDKDEESSCGTKLRVEGPYGIVTLNFELDLPDQVAESLSKIRAFERLLKKFRKAAEKEAKFKKKKSYEQIKDEFVTVR